MFKIVLEKGNRYWDPYTSTHLKRSNREETFTDEDIENYDMSNIEYAVQVGVLRKIELDQDTESESESSEEELKTEPMSIEDEEDKVTTDEVELKVEEVDTEKNVEDEKTSDETEEDTSEEIEVELLNEDEEEEFDRCQAKTSSGSQCKNEAKYPEDNPMYCHIHKSKSEE